MFSKIGRKDYKSGEEVPNAAEDDRSLLQTILKDKLIVWVT